MTSHTDRCVNALEEAGFEVDVMDDCLSISYYHGTSSLSRSEELIDEAEQIVTDYLGPCEVDTAMVRHDEVEATVLLE